MGDQYSPLTALLFVFNLIVGTGALTLPKAFSQAGWAFSTILMVMLAFVSYVTATFVIEAMSTCNAIIQWSKTDKMKRVSRYLRSAVQVSDSGDEASHDSEDAMLLPSEYIEHFPSEPQRFFTIDRKIELTEMATVLFSKTGQILFYVCLCFYLFGDLTIYAAAIGKSLVDVTCFANQTNKTDQSGADCWASLSLTRWNVYQFYLVGFLILFGPYAYFNVQKTKYLQMVTTVTRWLAFSVMVGLTVVRLASSGEKHGSPKAAVPAGLPALVGSCVYAFMCHHSLPSLLSPVSDKARLFSLLAADYLTILSFYLVLALTAVFAFPSLEDLFTLNFAPSPDASFPLRLVDYFLTLFPVFTLTASFPIIAVTLRSNFQAMFSGYDSWYLHKLCLPSLAIVPPVLVAMTTENIEVLVGITGSYAGVGIQYIMPAVLVLVSRASVPEPIVCLPNLHASPFRAKVWPYLVITWASLCLVLVTFDIAQTHFA